MANFIYKFVSKITVGTELTIIKLLTIADFANKVIKRETWETLTASEVGGDVNTVGGLADSDAWD